MIVKTFNNGWGGRWPIVQLEQQLVQEKLGIWNTDDSNTVVINSTWYTKEYHEKVLIELRNMDRIDRIVLVAMLDPAIPKSDWYNEFDCSVVSIGYYPGDYKIDFWAKVLEKFYQPINETILTDTGNMTVPYMCLNRKPHWHRIKLYKQLEQRNLLDLGMVSLGGNPPVRTLLEDVGYQNLTPNSGPDQFGISNDIVSLGNIDYWKQCFLNLVTETAWDINHIGFVSEKIYKPIVGCRPFLVYDPDGGVGWLTTRGFEVYTRDFNDITDLNPANPDHIPDFIKTLSAQPSTYFRSKYLALKEKILYNKNHFNQYVKG